MKPGGCGTMKKAALVTLLAIIVAENAHAARKKMDPLHNTGGYINIGKTEDHQFEPSSSPSSLPSMSSSAKNTESNKRITEKVRKYLEDFPATTAVLLIENGKILLERYQGVGKPTSEFYSMSIGKSMTSLAVGQALCHGEIASLTVKGNKLVPELKDSGFGRSTVRELLMMSSGAYKSVRSGQPAFSGGIGLHPTRNRPYFGYSWPVRLGQTSVDDLLWGDDWSRVENKNAHRPGEMFNYKGMDTLALGKIVERATGMSLAAYFDKTIWQKIGAEGTGHWEADRNGSTMASSGFQARLRDWGKIAVWILEQRKQLNCLGRYLKEATSTQIPMSKELRTSFTGYGDQWWTDSRRAPGFWGLGYAGQMLAINPETGKILLKFGYRHDKGSGLKLMNIFREWNKE